MLFYLVLGLNRQPTLQVPELIMLDVIFLQLQQLQLNAQHELMALASQLKYDLTKFMIMNFQSRQGSGTS